MTILVTGSTGKTARRVTALLEAAKQPVLVASRSAPSQADPSASPPQARFDWRDASTHELPFTHPAVATSPITAVYVVLPYSDAAMTAAAVSWLRLARERGVRRFVLLSASAVEEGGPLMGTVHAELRALGVEWAVLRPSWFMENFSESGHAASIKDLGKIFTAAAEGRIPFVSSDDIAALAAKELTTDTPRNGEYLVLGPELLTYDDVARTLTKALGKEIVHVNMPHDKLVGMLVGRGMREDYATMMVDMDVNISNGAEDRMNDDVERALGRKPVSFEHFVQKNKQVWV